MRTPVAVPPSSNGMDVSRLAAAQMRLPGMSKLDERTTANMDVVLEQACRIFPHGGDHEQRRRIAQKLMLSARKGNTTLGGLTAVASAAVQELTGAEQNVGRS
jgi:hypothetical protein